MTTDIRKAAEPPLRPCPFCGGEPYSCRHLSYSNWGVACQCGATGPTKNAGYRPLREAEIRAHNEAVEAWNQRAGLAAEQPQPKVQPAVGVQACRPEDRAMLSTPAGAELLTKVAMALTVPQAVATAPKRIWLQVSDDRADMDEPFPGDGATWCADSVVDAEVEYVRADLAPPPSAPCPHIRSSGGGEWATNWCALAEQPQPEAVAWPKVNGTARMFDNARALMVIMEREPTDDEMRAFDDAIKGWGTSPPSAPEPSEAEDAARYRWLRDPKNADRDEWNMFGPYSSPADIDAAIDDALRAAAAARNTNPA